MNANHRVIPRPAQERFEMSSKELCAFWDTILLEYSMRATREQSIQLYDNTPFKAICNGDEKS